MWADCLQPWRPCRWPRNCSGWRNACSICRWTTPFERKQFGKPIGSFQAVKHHLADVAVQIEFAKARCIAPPMPWPSSNRAPGRLGVPRQAGDGGSGHGSRRKNGIQVHGAMGYTWEVDLQMFMKRAWALDKAWGDRGFTKGGFARRCSTASPRWVRAVRSNPSYDDSLWERACSRCGVSAQCWMSAIGASSLPQVIGSLISFFTEVDHARSLYRRRTAHAHRAAQGWSEPDPRRRPGRPCAARHWSSATTFPTRITTT